MILLGDWGNLWRPMSGKSWLSNRGRGYGELIIKYSAHAFHNPICSVGSQVPFETPILGVWDRVKDRLWWTRGRPIILQGCAAGPVVLFLLLVGEIVSELNFNISTIYMNIFLSPFYCRLLHTWSEELIPGNVPLWATKSARDVLLETREGLVNKCGCLPLLESTT